MDETSGHRMPIERREIVALSALGLAWIVFWLVLPSEALRGDVLRFHEIAHGGRPYVDQAVEYPPLETLLVMVIGRPQPVVVAMVTSVLNAGATLAVWWLLRWRWSVTVGLVFLWSALPLQAFMPVRLDMVVVAIVVLGVVTADRGRQAAGGAAFAVSILSKVWPVVMLPLLVLRHHRRALVVALIGTAAGLAIWIGAVGADALAQVGGYRGATGWQVESVFGVVSYLVSHTPLHVEAGATRTGTMGAWAPMLLRALTVAGVGLAWFLGARRPVDPAGAPALAAVSVLLLLSPVASPQYVAWLLPWAAVTAPERRSGDVRILMIAAGVFASGVFLAYWRTHDPFIVIALSAARAVCILGLAIVGFTHGAADVSRPID